VLNLNIFGKDPEHSGERTKAEEVVYKLIEAGDLRRRPPGLTSEQLLSFMQK
jgi:hypothetical protein